MTEHTKDRIIKVTTIVELTLILTGVMYYYIFQLPRQVQCQKANDPETTQKR